MRCRTLLVLTGLACLCTAVGPGQAHAQIRASEPATLVQAIDGTEFRIDYYRPRTRGRAPLFGPDAVVWEHIWTPGANWATKLSFQKPIAPFVEVMRWDFEDISSTGGVLALRWGTHRFAWDVKVQPSMRQTVVAAEASPAEGSWTVWMMGPDGQEMGPMRMDVSLDDHGHLLSDISGAPPNPDGSPSFFDVVELWLLPANAEGWFIPGEAYDHVLRETWAGSFMEFDLAGGQYESFMLRDDIDRPFMRGERAR